MRQNAFVEFLNEEDTSKKVGFGYAKQKNLVPFDTGYAQVTRLSDERVFRLQGVAIEGAMVLFIKRFNLARPAYVRSNNVLYYVEDFKDFGLMKYMLIKKIEEEKHG
jgi:hypothetical protein